jgi:hypothetical protein
MGDPVTLFDQPRQGGQWKTFWVTFPDLAPDWNDRAVSVRFFPGPFNPLPFATLHSQPLKTTASLGPTATVGIPANVATDERRDRRVLGPEQSGRSQRRAS